MVSLWDPFKNVDRERSFTIFVANNYLVRGIQNISSVVATLTVSIRLSLLLGARNSKGRHRIAKHGL